MVSSISSSLNSLLATNFSGIPRYGVTPAQSPAAASAQEVKAAFGNLKPGATVSSRTDYTVSINGQLVPKSSVISVTDATDESSQQPAFYRERQTEAKPQSFADLAKPKPILSPTEEAVLFDADAIDGDGQPRRFYDNQGAQDENGDAVEVEVIAPDTQPTQTLAQQQQARVSNLYARVGEIVYSVEPAVAFAA